MYRYIIVLTPLQFYFIIVYCLMEVDFGRAAKVRISMLDVPGSILKLKMC